MAGLTRTALEALYRRLERPLYNVAYRCVWDREEARDVVQESFVRLWSMRRRVEEETVEPLVYRIALNLARSRRRRRRVRRMLSLDSVSGVLRDPRDPESDHAGAERERRLRREVESLPDDLRPVVLLCAFTDLRYGEIASALRIPEGTVGSRRNRALKLLREAMSGEGGDERP
jgi:RNA polymerase sigma-70 factor (ECF subfamily)